MLGRDGKTKGCGGLRQGKVVIREGTDSALCELACRNLTLFKPSCDNCLPGSPYRGINVLRITSRTKTAMPVSMGDSNDSLVSHDNRRATGSED